MFNGFIGYNQMGWWFMQCYYLKKKILLKSFESNISNVSDDSELDCPFFTVERNTCPVTFRGKKEKVSRLKFKKICRHFICLHSSGKNKLSILSGCD